MSLSIALNSAQSSISATASQTALASRNITGASEAGYSRKAGILTTIGPGTVRIAEVRRATEQALHVKMLGATSTAAASQAQLDGLKALARTVGDPETDGSLAGALGSFGTAMQTYADNPSDTILARNLLASATDLADTLNNAQAVTQGVRQTADANIAASVERVNDLLLKFEVVNRQIVYGTSTGADVTDQLDARDRLLGQISEEMGISVIHRANNDMAIYTDGGVTLFEKTPRTLTFARNFGLAPGVAGNPVMLDGVPITGAGATMPIKSGRIYGDAQMRDVTAVAYQAQIDDTARGLVQAFQEVPPPPAVPRQGMFVAAGYPALPGLAGSVRVNPLADPSYNGPAADPDGAGPLPDPDVGSLNRLRDGFTMSYNPGTPPNASFSGRLQQLIDNLGVAQAFTAAGLPPSASLSRVMAASASWLESVRKETSTTSEYNNTFLERTREALSNETGVNLDEELALMLELERSYGASARIITVVDNMLKTLLDAARP